MNELLSILREHYSKMEVTIPKNSNCRDFWDSLAGWAYMNSTYERMGIDCDMRDVLHDFASVDSLDLLNKQGRILKRFAKFWKEKKGTKLSDEVMGILGDRLQYFVNNENEHNTFTVDFTDSIDWEDGKFGKSGSCWWGTYGDSIPTFQNGGGWAIRFYDSMDDTYGIGRTWIMPMNGVLVCFNSYGIERATVSKVIKEVFNGHGVTLHYKRVTVENSQNDTIPYINDNSGFVMFPEPMTEEDIQETYDLDLEVENDNSESCCHCGRRIDTEDDPYNTIGDSIYCERCTDELFAYCDRCDEYCDRDDVHESTHRRYDYLCCYCARSLKLELCEGCEKYTDCIETEDTEEYYCEDCQDDLYHCDECHNWYKNSDSCNCTDGQEEEEEEEEETLPLEDIERDYIVTNVETVRIATGFRDYRESIETVYRHELIAGLYIRFDGQNFILVHDESGLAVRSGINSLHLAIELLERIGALADWTRSKESITEDSVLLSRVREQLLILNV